MQTSRNQNQGHYELDERSWERTDVDSEFQIRTPSVKAVIF